MVFSSFSGPTCWHMPWPPHANSSSTFSPLVILSIPTASMITPTRWLRVFFYCQHRRSWATYLCFLLLVGFFSLGDHCHHHKVNFYETEANAYALDEFSIPAMWDLPRTLPCMFLPYLLLNLCALFNHSFKFHYIFIIEILLVFKVKLSIYLWSSSLQRTYLGPLEKYLNDLSLCLFTCKMEMIPVPSKWTWTTMKSSIMV